MRSRAAIDVANHQSLLVAVIGSRAKVLFKCFKMASRKMATSLAEGASDDLTAMDDFLAAIFFAGRDFALGDFKEDFFFEGIVVFKT